MDPHAAAHFTDLITLAQTAFFQVEHSTDITPERAILRLRARYGRYRVLVTELLSEGMRKYSYYVLDADRIEVGFDNTPDPRALQISYGRRAREYTGEPIPHVHREDKALLSLTGEMAFADFLNWLRSNVTANSA